jgi:D-alanine-D-alanine ligase-like ATP-grasp enzyme
MVLYALTYIYGKYMMCDCPREKEAKISCRNYTNKEMFIKAHKLIKLECSGIDYMSSDIKVPYYENDGHIIEINDMVDTKIHIDADNGAKPNFLFENIVKSF